MDESSSYDLAPPPPTRSNTNAEGLAERLFSADHLHLILKDQTLSHRFTVFLNRYRPHSVPALVRYLESQKALTAIRYANTLADSISTRSRQSSTSSAAVVDTKFENFSRRSIDELVSEALPAYITYRMVNVVTECLVKEITGSNTPLMQELIQGLAEVYCMTDPSLPDNPIVFASEEFYNTTQYGREYVIGKNCRFLQGPKTDPNAVARIHSALQNGQEVCEILLNYRRNGHPFLNLVMMAPLMDHRGNVKYFIGCQIDISCLIEGGRSLESFKLLLSKDRELEMNEKPLPDPFDSKPPLKALRDFSELLNDEEIEVVKERGRRNSMESGRSTPTRATNARRLVGMDEPVEPPNIWPPSHFGASGRLPGVYQNYLLVRPYPSLRIIFTSAALRIPGLSQSRLMDRIGGPSHIRDGLIDALAAGVGVTAKVSWLTHSTHAQHSHSNSEGSNGTDGSEFLEGRHRWIHCTPLMGSDAKVGVWMVVMVEQEAVTGTLNHHSPRNTPLLAVRDFSRDGWPLRGMGVSAASARFTSAKLYADYLRREGRTGSSEERRSIRSIRSGRSGEEDAPKRSASARRNHGIETIF
ncbi:uncharacterized protein BDR25DRAFT_246288 [Lindgomyces ingoldianus]|uniref:Uncharacterized protein n=1 Tax=Lindgomyces ingoldianus TaxID=673940 RepID=A0ACB6Q8H8_9PLEO|nr:uncharacterized protein BDR25DRAFT_246288 [Lindgomyces ingoldianus]KAF2463172.1 hypothetical protein BDR25DRAFT_246288 [Lindgomyces ingoldianus]